MSVSFGITPESIVDHTRSLLLSETSFDEAKFILTDCSLEDDIAIDILKGDVDLEQAEDGMVNLIEADNKRYKEDIEFIYRNYLVHEGQNLKAYAVVKTFGYIDDFARIPHKELTNYFIEADYIGDKELTKVQDYINSHIAVQPKQLNDKKVRALHYADDFNNDIVVEVMVNGETGYLLCKKIDFSVPSFLNIENNDLVKIYNRFSRDDVSQNRGYVQSYKWYEEKMFGSINMSNKKYPQYFTHEDGSQENYLSAIHYIEYESLLKSIKRQVLNDPAVISEGFIDIKTKNNQLVASVPKLPFMYWVFEGVGYRKMLPKYTPHSPIGMKLQNDSRYHSDWMIAAGLDLDKDYDSNSLVYSSSISLKLKLQNEYLNFDVGVLSSGDNKTLSGRAIICTPENAADVKAGNILILPRGSFEFDEHIRRAVKDGRCGIITANGSRGCHVAVVSREFNYIVLHDPQVLKKVGNFDNVTLNPQSGSYFLTAI